MKSTKILFCLMAVAGGVCPRPCWASGVIANAGTTRWTEAARAGRADMLILGDSVVLFGGNGWDAGMTSAANGEFGLAGTGLSVNGYFSGEGEGYGVGGGTTWASTDRASVPTDLQKYAWSKYGSPGSAVVTADGTARDDFGFSIDGTTLPGNAAYNYDVWTASPGGSLDAYRRVGASPYTRLASADASATAGYQKTTFGFAANAAVGPQNILLENTTDTSVLYSRLTRPGASGATITSWGYGGKSTLDFFQEQYATWDPQGREAWLTAVVDGGSGKLNVVIAEGFNDRNETSPSVNGVADGSSADAFADNIGALIASLREDWARAGHHPQDLSFTLLGMYDIVGSEGGRDSQLAGYAAELAEMALADQQLTFVDLYALAPSYEDAAAAGYIQDGIHLERSGALEYSRLVMDAIVPEPGSLSLLLVGALSLLRRRR